MQPARILWHRIQSGIILVALLASSAPALAADAPPFPDMEHSWFRYQEAVTFLQKRNIIEGNPDGTFKPNATVNRAEFLKMVFASRADSKPVGGDCFSDVPADAWFAPYVCAAARRDIVKGYPDGTFKPEQAVNVAEALKMIVLTYGKENIEERSGKNWYEPYTDYFDDEKILARHSYIPWENLNRERAADVLARMLHFDEDRVIANLSPGCGKSPRDVPETITVNGVERSFLLTTPRRYVNSDAFPLIIAFHGRTNSNEDVRQYFHLDKTTDDYFIAYPAALQKDTGTFHWTDPSDKIGNLRDVAFFDAIVKELGESYCIDMDRIFVVGHSLGAWFANSVACARGDVVRGSATVGGSGMIAPCKGPAAAMIINNPADALSPQSGAEAVRDQRLKTNACKTTAAATEPESLSCERYVGCDGKNPVVWCPHTIDRMNGTYYPHLWPDQAADAIIDFFNSL